jgi:hypothetical protein
LKSISIICALLLAWGVGVCTASPDLDSFKDIEGVRVYADHDKTSVFYLSPSAPNLAIRTDGTPDYGLSLYRYLGTKGTGDAGDFWVRGVLTFGIDRVRESGVTSKIRKKLRLSGVKSPRLKSMPVSGSRTTLMFADQEGSRVYGMRLKTGPMVVPLDPDQAEILWQAVESGQTLVSVSIEETLGGVRKGENDWGASDTSLGWVVPLEMDMAKHPDNFQKLDLGGRMTMGYTGLDIFCFDFIENLEESLYAKIVEVSMATNGRDLVETVTFRDDGKYRTRIDFKLAKDIDEPYRYRISRVFKDGTREAGRWQEKAGETLLDITAYLNTEDTDGDTEEQWTDP